MTGELFSILCPDPTLAYSDEAPLKLDSMPHFYIPPLFSEMIIF